MQLPAEAATATVLIEVVWISALPMVTHVSSTAWRSGWAVASRLPLESNT